MRRYLSSLFLFLAVAITGCDAVVKLTIPPGSTTPAAASADGQTGPVRVYFTSPDRPATDPGNIAHTLAGYICQAKKTIDVCAFELDNKVITAALAEAFKRGVNVRLVTETNYLEESGTQELKRLGVPVVDDQREGALMHNKFMVFDNQSVWTGSLNFTENCAYKNNNHGVFIDDPRIAANYATKFGWMFDNRKFGGPPVKTMKIPHPAITLADGTKIENYFSTHDRVAEKVTNLVKQAQRSVHFLAFSYTHKAIAEAMLARATAGVEVLGVYEKTQTAGGYSTYQRLREAGAPVQVYLDANGRNMHHKVIVIDGGITLAGSFNFSDGADKSNDENVVIIHNPEIARRFETEFQKLYHAARQADGGAVSTTRPVR